MEGAVSKMNTSRVIWALKNGEVNEVQEVLKTTEDVNQRLDGRPPLHYAADFGQLEVLEYLLKKEANVNATDKHGLTPLMCACFEGHVEIAKKLLERGADTTMRSDANLTAFDSDNDDIKELLKSAETK